MVSTLRFYTLNNVIANLEVKLKVPFLAFSLNGDDLADSKLAKDDNINNNRYNTPGIHG